MNLKELWGCFISFNGCTSLLDTTKGLILTNFTMAYGTIATFLSGNTKIPDWIKFTLILILSLASLIISYAFYGFGLHLLLLIVIIVFLVIICYKLIFIKGAINGKKIDELIRKSTKSANAKKPLKIFGGDLGFFDDVEDNSIKNNKQLNQIIDMKFREIQIMCLKPIEEEDKLRLGYLVNILKKKVEIKFYDSMKCSDCSKLNCDVIKFCNECKYTSECRVRNRTECQLILKNKLYFCYNPDTNIRGRIMQKSNGASFGVMSIKEETDRYIPSNIDSRTTELNLYILLWEVWWEKCQESEEILKECKSKYTKWGNEQKTKKATPPTNLSNLL